MKGTCVVRDFVIIILYVKQDLITITSIWQYNVNCQVKCNKR